MGLTGSKRKEKDITVEENVTRTNPVSAKKLRTADICKYAEVLKAQGVLPDSFLVHEAKSNKFVDEDGDVANEFYQETLNKGEQRKLRRILSNIKPRGIEKYKIPRLKPDIPVVIWEVGSN